MVLNKSLDEISLIAALLRDVHSSHGVVFNARDLKQTLAKVSARSRSEGSGFLTKALPRLGKALDSALSGGAPLQAQSVGFEAAPLSELPMFLWEFFSRVLHRDGTVLQDPCASSVRILRRVLYLFYKYELPYSVEQEQEVLAKFVRTEQELLELSPVLQEWSCIADDNDAKQKWPRRHKVRYRYGTKPHEVRWVGLLPEHPTTIDIIREARILLNDLFSSFDPRNIVPRHGPGTVSTREQLWGKYRFTNVSPRIAAVYPVDEYFYTSLGHVCDSLAEIQSLSFKESSAKVILVPKDSRGPRLISCEPLDFQWIQQGLSQAIVRLVESHPLTKGNVNFTDQEPNRMAALIGSIDGRYATLDLNEASDRVSLDLVRLLFPKHVYTYLEACRSLTTVLPSGEILTLRKFAPMGSALCFPVLALTIWALLTAASPGGDLRERILVYGDDVIVPTASAANAIELLELFGLKINRSKSCTNGLFRESCGMDAFKGTCVTPVRFRTVWSSSPSAEVYTSWISYANSMYDIQCFNTYDLIVGWLSHVYREIPGEDMHLACPSLREVPDQLRPKRTRTNSHLQKRQWKVWDVRSVNITKHINGWSMLLRYFTEGARARLNELGFDVEGGGFQSLPFSVSRYTKRRASILARRWR